MSETYTLAAEPRTITGKKVGALRRAGLVPAVIYGAKIQPIHLQVPYRPLEITLAKAGGTHLIDVTIAGQTQTVLARVVQRDVIRGDIMHVDFIAIDRTIKIAAEVPVHLVGESPAVLARQGVVQHDLQTLSIEALPGDLVDQVVVDLAMLKNYGDHITVADLVLPAGIVVLADKDVVVARIVGQKAVTEEMGDVPVSAEVEVISRGKADEEEGA